MRGDQWTLLVLIAVGMAVLGRTDVPAEVWGTGWMWPVPDMIDSAGVVWHSVISQEFHAPAHLGVDILYRRPSQPPDFGVPPGVDIPVVAARAGTLWQVTQTPRGWAVVLDHGAPWATFYTHLRSIDPLIAQGVQGVARTGAPLEVAAGQALGVMGADPLDGEHVVHLHFATWYKGYGDKASIDPRGEMTKWPRSTLQIR